MNRYTEQASFVPALREPDPPKPIVLDGDWREMATLPAAGLTKAETTGSHTDRAKSFQIVSFPIAVMFGVGAVIVAVAGWSIPVLSLAGLTVFWLAYLGWWLMAWVVHNIVSPDGLALVHTLLGWRMLYREQAERHRRYREGR